MSGLAYFFRLFLLCLPLFVAMPVFLGCPGETVDGDGGDGDGDGDGDICSVGSEGCPCTGGGGCDPGLTCYSNLCVNAGSPVADAGSPVPDGGDSGTLVPPDAGALITDGGPPIMDAGDHDGDAGAVIPPDAGAPITDGGPPIMDGGDHDGDGDAGMVVADAGVDGDAGPPITDGGPPITDGGDHDGDAGDSDAGSDAGVVATDAGSCDMATDLDCDGILDADDPDDDNDGIVDGDDACATGDTGWTSTTVTDHDSDGCQDSSTEDPDDDNDGIADGDDACAKGDTGWTSNTTTDLDGDGCQDGTESPDPLPPLQLVSTGTGLDEIVTVEADGLFRLAFEAADNWGIAQWYDLVNDPGATVNLAYSHQADPGRREPGLLQMVWSGTTPDDPKLYTFAAKYYQPAAARSFTILDNSEDRVVVEAISHPLLAAGVVEEITVAVRYYIYPNGKIYINATMTAAEPQNLTEWRCAVLGLHDPQNSLSACPDAAGWIRSSAAQNPYSWSATAEKYLFAYWSPSTPAPYADWTKASIMLVPIDQQGGNPQMVDQNCHGWDKFKRWYYRGSNFYMEAGESITHEYLMQLGAENTTDLPNLMSAEVCDLIADAYIADPQL